MRVEHNATHQAEEMIRDYNNVVSLTKRKFVKITVVALSLAFTYAMRSNIFVLYAQTFDNSTHIYIAVTVYASYLMTGIASFIFGNIGDKWRFDYLLVVATLLDVITFYIEATTTSFYALCLAYGLGGQPLNAIVISMISKLLPIDNAKQIFGIWIQFYTLGVITGPIAGGIISHFFSYHTVFYVSAIIASILSIYVFIFLRNFEYKIITQQSDLRSYYNYFNSMYIDGNVPSLIQHLFNKNKLFPVCRGHNHNNHNHTYHTAYNPRYHSNVNHSSFDSLQHDSQTNAVGCGRWFFLFVLFVIEGCCFGGENAI